MHIEVCMLFAWRNIHPKNYWILSVIFHRHLVHLNFSHELFLHSCFWSFLILMLKFYSYPIFCRVVLTYFSCRFDKELNKEVAIKVIDLEEAWVPNINFTLSSLCNILVISFTPPVLFPSILHNNVYLFWIKKNCCIGYRWHYVS